MTTGIYPTTDPNKRIRVVQDDDFYVDPDFTEEVKVDLLRCYEEGNYYGVIVLSASEMYDSSTGLEWIEWDEIESVWGCAGYDDVAVEVAKEHFGLTVVKG